MIFGRNFNMKTNNKQASSQAVRKEKEKKKELLSGWSQDKEALLQDDIGIETWFDHECSSDEDNDTKDRRYKCALLQSLERRKRTANEPPKITPPTSKSATRRNQTRQAECCKSSITEGPQENLTPEPLTKREPTMSSKSSASITLLSEKSTASTSSSVGHVTLNQSTSADETRRDNKCDFHSKDWAPQKLAPFSTSNDSPIVTLLRYEERLKNRRENRLNKRFGDIFKKVEKSDTISPKTPVTMSHVCFTQGMIQPMSKATQNSRYHPRPKLPSLETNSKNKTQNSKMTSKLSEKGDEPVKGVVAEGCRGSKLQSNSVTKDSTSKKEVPNTTNTIVGNKSTAMIVNKRKFNFDVLENYALIRNARKDTNFTEYVKMIRKFQNLPVQGSDKELSTEERKGMDFRTHLRRTNSSDSLSFDTVRALWHEAQKSRLASHALSERLSLNAKGMGGILMLDVDSRNRSSSEPIGNVAGNDSVKIHKGKYTCPLQRILAVTSKRMQANDEVFLNQIKSTKHLKISQDEESVENKRVGITRSKTGIQCYIMGRSTPKTEDTAVER